MSTPNAPVSIDEANAVINVYIPLVIIASSIIYYASIRSSSSTEVLPISSIYSLTCPIPHYRIRSVIDWSRCVVVLQMEPMSTNDAMMFPVIGSCVLFGLFLMFKFFAKEYLNYLFTFYFLLVGAFTVSATVLPFVEVPSIFLVSHATLSNRMKLTDSYKITQYNFLSSTVFMTAYPELQ